MSTKTIRRRTINEDHIHQGTEADGADCSGIGMMDEEEEKEEAEETEDSEEEDGRSSIVQRREQLS